MITPDVLLIEQQRSIKWPSEKMGVKMENQIPGTNGEPIPRTQCRIRCRLFGTMLLIILLGSVIFTTLLIKVQHDAVRREADAKLLTAAECTRTDLERQYHDEIPDRLAKT
jgi:hypothetical protein